MSKLDRIKQYFGQESYQIDLLNFSLDILLTSLCAYILSRIYIKHGRSLSNRSALAQNFVLFALTTMMVISVIKSSIALSLGLVGALSIVRFRAAIKDPEELVYLFLTMGIGLGFGSGNRYLTLVFFLAICLIIIIKERFAKAAVQNPMFLFVRSEKITDIKELISEIENTVKHLEINRYELSDGAMEAIFNIEISSADELSTLTENLSKIDPEAEISFTENKGLFN